MKPGERFVEQIEALAEAFEQAGRTDLSALCDRAAYWLDGGNGLDVISLSEVVGSCRSTLEEAFKNQGSLEEFTNRTVAEILGNLQSIETEVVAMSDSNEELIDKAAKLQAVAILTSELFAVNNWRK
jgi:hypothetical protein